MLVKTSPFLLVLLVLWCHTSKAQKLHLNVKGENANDSTVIDSIGYQRTFDNYKALANEIDQLKKVYWSSGYIESELLDLSPLNDTLYQAHFSLKTKYASIRIIHENLVPLSILKKTGFLSATNDLIVPISHVETTLEKLNSEIANNGNPFSSLVLTDIQKEDTNTLVGKLSVSTQQKRTIDKLIVKGYEKFPRTFVQRYLNIKVGQDFSLEKIKEKTETLNNLSFANQIKEPEVLFSKDSTILYMYIEKSRSNTFDGFLGFGTNEATNNIEFDGYLDLNLSNNLNFGESLQLLYKSDENDQQTFNLNLNAPYLFKSPVGLGATLNIFKRDSSFVTVTQAAKLTYQLNSKHAISAGISATTSTDLLEVSTTTITDYTSNHYFLNYTFTKRQNHEPLFPVNFMLDLSTGVGKRTYNTIEEPQTNLQLNTFKIFNLNARNSLYGRLSAHYLVSDSYLENELPRFGGINSIRGFEENSLIANLYSVLNTEYRYKLNNTIYVHSVIDAAYFENQLTDQKAKLFGFGFGFGLLTKAGLFRFNYSSGKTEGQKFKLSDSKIHLSLTTRF